MKNKKLTVLIIVIGMILLGAIAYWYKNHDRSFSVGTLEFSYPPNLVLNQTTYEVTLSHSIPHEHPNPCDFKGDKPVLNNLTDFSATFKFFPRPLASVIKSIPNPSLANELTPNGELKLSPGFIDPYQANKLKGYKITQGVEGCGNYSYYFPLGSYGTLLVTRPFVPEFNSINSQVAENLKLPGIIPPPTADKLFEQILSSAK